MGSKFYGVPTKRSLVNHADHIPYDSEFCRATLSARGTSGSVSLWPRQYFHEVYLNNNWWYAANVKYRTSTTDDLQCLGYNNYSNTYLNGLQFRQTYDDGAISFGLMDTAPSNIRGGDVYASSTMRSEYSGDWRLWHFLDQPAAWTRGAYYCNAIISCYFASTATPYSWFNGMSLVVPWVNTSGVVAYDNSFETEVNLLDDHYVQSMGLSIATVHVYISSSTTGYADDSRYDITSRLWKCQALGCPHIKYYTGSNLQAVTCQEIMMDLDGYTWND